MPLEDNPVIEAAIQRHLASGRFDSPESVVVAALRHLDDYAQSLADLEESLEDEAAGRVRTIDEVAAEISAKHGFSDSE